MKQQYRIDIRMLSGGYEGPGAAFNEDFFITNDIVNTPQMYMFGMPMRFDALVIGLTRKGTMEANFNLRPFAARENQLMLSIPENLVELKGVSADYQGWYVAISMDYLRKLDVEMPVRFSHENPSVQKLYSEYFEQPLSHKSHKLLHTNLAEWTLK